MRQPISLSKPPIITHNQCKACYYIYTAGESCPICKPKRGGKRDGAGRKHKYGLPTTRISVPTVMLEEIQRIIADRICGIK